MTIRNLLGGLFNLVPREEYDLVVGKNLIFQEEIDREIDQKHLENYITGKYPKVEKLYGARPIPPLNKRVLVDPRVFFTPYDSKVLKIVKKLKLDGLSDDEKAYKLFLWVRKNIKYKYDKDNFGFDEYWSFAFETLSRKFGDCDSQSILLANLCLAAGIPYYKLRLTVGPVKGGYHCFLTYYDESRGFWILLDTTFFVNTLPICKRKQYKDEKNYFKEIWFSFDLKHVYQKSHKDWTKDLNNSNL